MALNMWQIFLMHQILIFRPSNYKIVIMPKIHGFQILLTQVACTSILIIYMAIQHILTQSNVTLMQIQDLTRFQLQFRSPQFTDCPIGVEYLEASMRQIHADLKSSGNFEKDAN
ncbi:hypothetical protein FGO68_gene9198 [Halteria grandinella]|uniref:Uncharacterized protein n=1 Tax=Halteria grandinella TaxID=5974 RepID=A0A8J8P5K0_HALGN|nr:hypothetical protein FGO68_gene9198 [Halteria grandinella]